MQSGYGGVSEFQQFIMDGGFAMAAAPPPPPPVPPQQQQAAQELGAPFRYQPLHHHAMHPQQHHHAPPQMPPHFFGGPTAAGGGGIPFTQQLLHHQAGQHHHHHLQLFHEQQHHHHHQQQQHQQQHHKPHPQPPPAARWAPHPHQHLGLDMEAAVPESSRAAAAPPSGMPPFLAAAMSFKLAVDPSGSGATGGTDDAMNDGGGGGSGMMLHGGGGAGGGEDEAATESRLRRWTGEEEASIKEPSWRPLDIDFIHSTSSSSKGAAGKDKPPTPESPSPAANAAANYFKKGACGDNDNVAAAAAAAGGSSSYKLFSELEAIYKPGSGGAGQTTGSGSGLTGDDNAMADLPHAPPPMCPDGDDLLPHAPPPANASEDTSAGEETETPAVLQPPPPPASMADARRKRKRRRTAQQEQQQAASSFFERLVQRLMEHQESLHAQFLDAMERRERERAARDEAWRRQESESFARERAARAHDRASAAAREAAIVSYLEKLSGQPVVLPPAVSSPAPAASEDVMIISQPPQHEASSAVGTELVPYDGGGGVMRSSMASPSRWPKQEVEALIRVRSGLERRFQEPGLKGPLWEEVSARMAAAGYGGRSAKRCKEKWENINKYFRKAKESGKKRPAHAKTCPYFDELNRLYSGRGDSSMDGAGKAASSELLDAVVKCPATGTGPAAADQAPHYGPPPGFADAGDGEDEGRREMVMDDGANKYDGGEDEGMVGRSSGGRAMAAGDQEEDEGESHGGHDDEDHH